MPSNPKNTRRCICCHEHADKSEMLRFVKSQDGRVFLDESQKADGRGVWIHRSDECRQKAKKKKLLNSAFRTSVTEDVYEQL